jgi:hypothetical protein
MTDVAVSTPSGSLGSNQRRSWFDALLARVERLPGPVGAFLVVGTVAIAIPLHIVEFIDNPAAFRIHPDLVIGASAPPLFLWTVLWLNGIALRALRRLQPTLDPDGPPEADIAADLLRTPNSLAIPALLIGAAGGVASVLQAPENWGIDPAHPGARQLAAILLSLLTAALMLGLLAHVVHQLRVVTRVHRTVRIELFHLEPLYAFSTLTAWTGIALLALLVGLLALLSISVGTFILVGASDMALTATIVVVAIACFFVPLLGLHARIADVKAGQLAIAQATMSTAIEAVRARVQAGDLEGAAKLKDAVLAADSSIAAIARISTWPWRAETLRGFVSAVVLPIGLFLVYELLRRALG